MFWRGPKSQEIRLGGRKGWKGRGGVGWGVGEACRGLSPTLPATFSFIIMQDDCILKGILNENVIFAMKITYTMCRYFQMLAPCGCMFYQYLRKSSTLLLPI